jgi:Protein of unknown function (DUF2844)
MAVRARHKIWWLATAAAIAASWSCVASATLGEPESSIATEKQASKASIKETSLGSYRVHELQSSSGTVIREYAGLDGKVFAVTWHGPFMPNLRDALGRYFDEYAAAASSGRMDRNHVQVEQDDLVVRVGGHMRAYRGLAYLPQAVPSGVSIGDLE